jgi:hypothetical protein
MASGGGPQDGDEGSTEVSLAHLNALLVSMTTAVNRLDAGLPLHTTTMPRSGETQTAGSAGSAHGAAETQLPPPTVPGSSSFQRPDAPQAAPASSPSGLAPPGTYGTVQLVSASRAARAAGVPQRSGVGSGQGPPAPPQPRVERIVFTARAE